MIRSTENRLTLPTLSFQYSGRQTGISYIFSSIIDIRAVPTVKPMFAGSTNSGDSSTMADINCQILEILPPFFSASGAVSKQTVESVGQCNSHFRRTRQVGKPYFSIWNEVAAIARC